MALPTILDELKKLSKKIKGSDSTATNTAEALAEIATAYSGGGGGGGASIESAALYPDSSNIIRDGAIVLSDGTTVPITVECIPALTVTSAAGSTTGTTHLTVVEALGEGNSYAYATDRSPAKPAIGEVLTGFTDWDGTSDITVDDGVVITLVEKDSDNKAVKAGTCDAVVAVG